MCPSLLCWPRELNEMETLSVSLLASDAVGRLSNRMSVESKDAIFFDKNVEASVAVVPRVLCLLFPANDQDGDLEQNSKQFAKSGQPRFSFL